MDDDVDTYIDHCLANQVRMDRGFAGVDEAKCTNPFHRYADWHGLPRAGLEGRICPGSWNFDKDGKVIDRGS